MNNEQKAINQAALQVAKHNADRAREAMTEAEIAADLAIKEAQKANEAEATGRAGSTGYHAYEALEAADRSAEAARRASRFARYAQEAAEWAAPESPEAAEATATATEAIEYAQAAERAAAKARRKTALAETQQVAVTISTIASDPDNAANAVALRSRDLLERAADGQSGQTIDEIAEATIEK